MTRKTNSAKSKSIITGILILMAYSMLASEVTDSKLIVLITDIISGFSVIGIATIFFTFFKQIAKPLSISYLSIKLIEGILMIVGGIFFIFNQGIREWIYESIHLHTFIVGGYLLYILLYKTQIVPKFISIWGIIAIFFLTLSTVLKLFGLSYQILDTFLLLIITNEVFLAFWLIIKGFNLKKLNS